MPEPRFDELIHASTRLSVMAMAAAGTGVEFRFIRDQVGVSDSVLSKHLSALESAGYLTVRKIDLGRGWRRTLVDITEQGDAAFQGHVAALDAIIGPSAGRSPAAGADDYAGGGDAHGREPDGAQG
ncbi:winged helix-turn-helix domain-containing protein [Streptomonospora wellingtoniae]|uniref:Transcriptional regulator n=1 Tax=Streptomonospora wellingtoniae TaxID=3075544 RepID=A0ABU2KRU6_9ACTN|nr:transcriptional regulator [Streptomonospora sp. DSM 45055]MDT0302007.1 transcriptional regulator [Streptomonospora sp. DSM 45055]